jgi:hypothetical protein
MVVHRWGEGDGSVHELVPVAAGDELASNFPKQDELGDVVEMAETAELRRIGADRHMLGKNRGSDWKFDRFTDWAERH